MNSRLRVRYVRSPKQVATSQVKRRSIVQKLATPALIADSDMHMSSYYQLQLSISPAEDKIQRLRDLGETMIPGELRYDAIVKQIERNRQARERFENAMSKAIENWVTDSNGDEIGLQSA